MLKVLIYSLVVVFSLPIFSQTDNTEIIQFKPFKGKNGLWGFSSDKNTQIDAVYDYVTDFSDGLALVKFKGKWGYIKSDGTWFFDPILDKGQPVQDGYAFIVQNGLTGMIRVFYQENSNEPLIDENGNRVYLFIPEKWEFVFEPKFDKIKSISDYYLLKKDGKYGFISLYDAENSFIPCEYDTLLVNYDQLVSAKKGNQWCVIAKGKMIVDGLSEPLKLNTYVQTPFGSGYIEQKQGKYGVLTLDGKWIVEPKYFQIEVLPFPTYYTNQKEASAILACYETDPNAIDPDLYNSKSNPTKISLLKVDGSIISTGINLLVEKYEPYSEIPTQYGLLAYRNNKLFILKKDFSSIELDADRLIPHLYGQYYIADGQTMDYLLNNQFKTLTNFYSIEQNRMIQHDVELIDPETGEYFIGDQDAIETDVNYLLVKKNEGNIQKAYYSLNEQKVISDWVSENEIYDIQYNMLYQGDNKSIKTIDVYFFGDFNQSKRVSYYLTGMEKASAREYYKDDQFKTSQSYILLSKINGEQRVPELIQYRNGSPKKINIDGELLYSLDIVTQLPYDPEAYYEGDYSFSTPFRSAFFAYRKNGKYGFILDKGEITDAMYDTIMQNDGSVEQVVTTASNGKYGYFDVYSGLRMEPQMDNVLTFYDLLYVGADQIPYAIQTYADDPMKSNYITIDGRIFYGRSNVFPFKKGMKYALYAYPDYSIHEIKKQSKSIYKKIYPTAAPGFFFAKKGSKMGIIDIIGNEIVPFEYKNLKHLHSNGDNELLFIGEHKGKKAVFNLYAGKILDGFEDIRFVDGSDFSGYLLTVNGKKKGVFNTYGGEVLPCHCDEITQEYGTNGYTYFICQQGTKKYAQSTATDVQQKMYDEIIGNEGYVKNGDQFDVYDVLTTDFIRKTNVLKRYIYGLDFNIMNVNGKFGAEDLYGGTLIEATYDEAYFLDNRPEVMVGIEKGIKYYIYVFTGERYTEDQW